MFRNFLNFLDKPVKDVLSDRIDQEPGVKKYWFQLGGAIALLLITVAVSVITMFKYDIKETPISFMVNFQKQTKEQIIVMPYPHQSYNNVSAWITDAVTSAYTFDFLNYDAQVDRASYYFTPAGYSTYLNALQMNKIRDKVVGSRLEISLVPLQQPVLVNGGYFGDTEFWRFKMPILVNFYGGQSPVVQNTMVEVLILRVPAYQNHKGLSIAEFNMAPI